MFEYPPTLRDGEIGFAIVTDRFVCLLGAEADAATGASLYALLDDDETRIADALDVLQTGVSLERFAIVEVIDPVERTFHVAVRGDVDVTMSGVASTRMTGPAGTAWVIGEAVGVDGLSLSLGGEPGDDRLPVRRGVVRTGMISVAERRPIAATVAADDDMATRPIELPRAADVETSGDVPRPAKRSAATAKHVETEQPARTLKPARKPRAAATAAAVAEKSAPVEDAAPAPAEAQAPADEAPAKPAGPTWRLLLPDGSEIEPPVVFGRRPWKGGPKNTLHVVAPSPNREISGVHIEVDVDGGGLSARDLDSTNGTVVYTPSRAPRLLHDGRRIPLVSGDILDLGESYRVTIDVRDE
ncbi:FHA domain-containing protein [Agromyces atrinae]|uniref:FHA domain-containing protein n=1 Tax=Agromyces atrinae TaxID=592376 RepID=UPI001F59B363|nr:FHA domain-containing protein [Agromyces atrinae]MCI2957441.1 FHA domain-containing protein [Agromyces atrinae]